MDSKIDYDPEFSQEIQPVIPPDPVPKKAGAVASERVKEWRRKNPEKYREYQRNYMKTYRKKQS